LVSATKFTRVQGADIVMESFMTRAENRHLGGVAPSRYRARMAKNEAEVLASAVCPPSVFNDQYDAFVEERSNQLAQCALAFVQ